MVRNNAEELRKMYPQGTRVRLIEMNDSQAPKPNTLGTIRGVDDIGNILMRWDNGSSLSLIYGVDKFVAVGEEKGEKI